MEYRVSLRFLQPFSIDIAEKPYEHPVKPCKHLQCTHQSYGNSNLWLNSFLETYLLCQKHSCLQLSGLGLGTMTLAKLSMISEAKIQKTKKGNFIILTKLWQCLLCAINHNMYTRGFTKFGIKVLWRLQFLEYLRTLIEVVLSLPCWLSQLNRAFWNFKLKVLKYSRTCSLHNIYLDTLKSKKILNHLMDILYSCYSFFVGQPK